MTTERWEQINRIFHAALERQPTRRHAFLTEACATDEALYKEVESLILAHEQSGEFIEQPASDLAADLFAGTHPRLIPDLTLGPYRIASLLGSGGMSEVYLADDMRLNRKVALKLLPPEFTVNGERVRRFEQEARAASALNHPNIITIHDIGQSQGCDFIATEFIDGKTLRELINAGAMRIEEVLDIAVQLASALSTAHEAGIIHRDIKPDNIMIRHDRIVKVLDFGLAKLASEQLAAVSLDGMRSIVDTSPGMIMGTVHYMSPEQAAGNEVDARTDVWSLGAVIYEMLTGRPPFTGETAPHVTLSILENEPRAISHDREVPTALERIVMKALSKDRDSRYQRMRDLLEDLRELQSSTPFQRRKSAATVAVAMIVLMVGIVSVGVYLSSRARVAPFANIGFTKVTVPRPIYSGCISPDGKYVAYISIRPEGQSLWLKQVATDSDVQLVAAAPVNYWALQFSRDGQFVYYVNEVNNLVGGVLYRIPIAGGTAERMFSRVGAFVISPNGRHVVFRRGSEKEKAVQLLTANLDGTNEQLLLQGAGDGPWFLSFDWSPDGKSIAFINGIPHGETMDWYAGEVPSSGGIEQRLTRPSTQRLRGLLWLPDQEHLLLSIDEPTGIAQLWLLSRKSRELSRITHDLNHYQSISVTADGRQILATMRSRPAKLWVGPAGDTRHSRVLTPELVGFDHVTWTPDGALISAEALSLWEMNSETGERRRLTSDGWAAYPVVTADGRYVVFALTSTTRLLNIWRMNRDGTNAVQLTTEGGTYPSVSTDGQWVYYTNSRDRHTGVWRVPLAGGTPERIVDALAFKAAVSPDGKLIAYAQEDPQSKQDQIVVKPIAGETVKVFNNTAIGYGNLRWAPDGQGLLFIESKTGDLELLPLAGGATQKLIEHDAEELFAFDLSPDGKRLAYTKGTLTSTLVLISDAR
jgi:Tol biopolymer transport system component/predicted Ser/Thr protein kinase